MICDSPLRSARRFWEIAPKSQFVCVKGTLIRFGFRAGAKAIQYNKHSLQQQLWLARKWTYAAMVRNKKEKKNQLTVCLRTFRYKCLFSHDVWYSKENVIFWKKKFHSSFASPSLVEKRLKPFISEMAFFKKKRQQIIISNLVMTCSLVWISKKGTIGFERSTGCLSVSNRTNLRFLYFYSCCVLHERIEFLWCYILKPK